MTKYSIGKTSELLKVSSYTLRYYDKIGIVSPRRSKGGYRYYCDNDIMALKNIELMKYAGMSLEEISLVINNYYNQEWIEKSCIDETIKLINKKKSDILLKIDSLNQTLKVADHVTDVLGGMDIKNKDIINEELNKIYSQIKGEK